MTVRSSCWLTAVAVTTLTANVRGAEPAPAYRVEKRADAGLIAGGAIVFAAGYLPAAVFAAEYYRESNTAACWVPVLGPLAYLALEADYWKPMGQLIIIADFLVQAGGATLSVIGAMGTEKRVRTHAATIQMSPMLGTSATGLTLRATF